MQRLAASLVVLTAWIAAGCGPGTPRNLVVISLDTLRADHLGLYGYARPTSPQLERWSQKAFVFDNAVSAANYTLASHHALFQSRSAGEALAERDTAPTLAAILQEQGFRTAAFTGGGLLADFNGFARGFDQWDEHNSDLAATLPKVRAFLDEAAGGDARFYLFVHCVDVHLPYDPPPPYDRLFDSEYRGSMTGKDTRVLLGLRKIFEGRKNFAQRDLAPPERAKVAALYDGEIARMDVSLGELLARLDAPDLRRDTLVVILSDHGEEFWDHGSVLHAHSLYQELLHVALLLRAPELEAKARRVEERVSLVDVVPTLLELLALPAPQGLRGHSLVPLLRGEPQPARPAFSESFATPKLQSVVDGDWKLIRDLDTGVLALYDLKADPGERSDLSASRPEERDRLRALLDARLGTGAGHQEPLPLPAELPTETKDRLRELGYIE